MTTICLDEVDSTNEYCKRLVSVENAVVVAKYQTAGKGTKGRSFISDEGGLYITVMKTYDKFDLSKTFSIMINCCVAVCKTVEGLGVKPRIRWANDVLVGNKKICGTLIENTISPSGKIRSIVGMGLNINNDLPEELEEIATSVKTQTGVENPVDEVRDSLLKNLEKNYGVEDYKKYIDWFGSAITIKTLHGSFEAVALDVAEDGRLVVSDNGEKKYISSAEISIRL